MVACHSVAHLYFYINVLGGTLWPDMNIGGMCVPQYVLWLRPCCLHCLWSVWDIREWSTWHFFPHSVLCFRLVWMNPDTEEDWDLPPDCFDSREFLSLVPNTCPFNRSALDVLDTQHREEGSQHREKGSLHREKGSLQRGALWTGSRAPENEGCMTVREWPRTLGWGSNTRGKRSEDRRVG